MPLGEYIFARIHQANPRLRSVFGVPGDFNLPLLEHMCTNPLSHQIEFVGICSELNAAYAADGYARAIKGLSVLITTLGVGELSSINGIAGAFAEYAPVLHIVGTTRTKQRAYAEASTPETVRNIHHLVQNKNPLRAPDHNVYTKCVEGVSVAAETLDNDSNSNLDKIDRVLCAILRENRPGYIFIPCDITDLPVSLARLAVPLHFGELNDPALLDLLTTRILDKLYQSRSPSVLEDALVSRFCALAPFDSFVRKLPADLVKLYSTPMARHTDETLPNFVGVYSGNTSAGSDVRSSFEQLSDCLLVMGYYNSEMNTGIYTCDYSRISDVVEVHPDYIRIDGEYVLIKDPITGERAFSMHDLMTRLDGAVDANRFVHNDHTGAAVPAKKPVPQFSLADDVPAEVLTQNKLIDFFNQYLRPNDIFVVETCTFMFSTPDVVFPPGVDYHSQLHYGSIGFALPAALGVCRAERDLGTERRIILVQGDGSAQMTIQELSSYLRYDIQAPEIFLLNNKGYTVERIIKGPTRAYNDINENWDWLLFFKVFGDPTGQKHSCERIDTTEQLSSLFGRKRSQKIGMFELQLEKLDVPQRFRTMFS